MRRRRCRLAVTVLAAAAALASGTLGASPAWAAQASASMVNAAPGSCGYYSSNCYGFSPQNFSIHQGDTITWTNSTTVTHTATADDGAFDTGQVSGGGHASTAPITAVGSHTYHCQIHSYMTGTVTVMGSTPPPTAPPPPTPAPTAHPTPAPTPAATPTAHPTPAPTHSSSSSNSTSSAAASSTAAPATSASGSAAVAAIPSLEATASSTSSGSSGVGAAIPADTGAGHTALIAALVGLVVIAAGGGAAWLAIRTRR